MKGQEFKDCFAEKNTSHWKGYADDELENLETLYGISIVGQLKTFFMEIGRSDGGVFGGDYMPLYDPRMGIRDHLMFQLMFKDYLLSDGYHDLCKSPFVFFTYEDLQFYYLMTRGSNLNVRFYDSNVELVEDTGLGLLEFLIDHEVPSKGNRYTGAGDLLKI